MANIKVSELPSASSFEDNDYAMIVQGGENKKIAKENMAIPKITKIYESNSSSWANALLGIDISEYDFLLLVTSHQTSLVPSNFDIYLTWNGWIEEAQKDGVTQRHIYRNGNDISWNVCWYRGINNYIGAGEINTIDMPRAVYGIKI